MPRHTLYAYVEGNDLADIAPAVELRLARFVRETRWRHAEPWVVKERREGNPSLRPGDLPDRNLGLNMHLPDGEPPGWFADVETLVKFLAPLQEEIGRPFVWACATTSAGFPKTCPSTSIAGPPTSRRFGASSACRTPAN